MILKIEKFRILMCCIIYVYSLESLGKYDLLSIPIHLSSNAIEKNNEVPNKSKIFLTVPFRRLHFEIKWTLLVVLLQIKQPRITQNANNFNEMSRLLSVNFQCHSTFIKCI